MGLRDVRGRAVTAFAVAAVSLVGAPASAAACDARTTLPDKWTRIAAPPFTSGAATMVGYDAADFDVDRLVATNGTAVAASADGGCSWQEAGLPADSTVPELPLGGDSQLANRTITQVRFAGRSSTGVWAIGRTELLVDGNHTAQPRVLYSEDGGRTFESRANGLPTLGRPVAVRGIVAGAAVLLVETMVPATRHSIYLTGNAGQSWVELWNGLPELEDLAVDLLGAADVWAWGEGGAYHGSLVSDRPPALVDALLGVGPVRTVDIALGADGRKEIAVFLTSGTERYVSRDGARTFDREPAPESVQSVSSHGLLPGLRAVSSLTENVLIEPPGGKPVDFSPRDDAVSEVQFVHAVVGRGFPLYAYHPLALYLRIVPFDFVAPPPPPPPPEPPVEVDVEPPVILPEPPSITPERPLVTLRPGERRVVDFRVALPPVPTPLDVFFMTDSTNSMADTIASVQESVQGIVDGLARTGIDAYFGIADFRDYPQGPQNTANYPYKLHRKVGPIDDELEEALEGLRTGGGTTDGDDSALEAIYQAATGAGRTDPLLLRGELIPPGLDAGFRAGAMQVILVASDDGMRHPDAANPGYPGPPIGDVTRALNERGIYLVGIEVTTSSSDTPRPELERLATATGAFAPPEGVDCDGDGGSDLASGEPMVCDFEPSAGGAVADAMVAMLNGIEDLADVDLAVTGPRAVVRAKARLHFADVNVKKPSSYRLPVEFRCGEANLGTDTPVRISARSRGEEIVATTATVRCATPEPPPAAPVIPPLVAAALIPPAPPAPAPNVNPNVNPNLNPNPQLNPNAGFAAQEEQELQLALAHDDWTVADEEYAMTGLAWTAAVAMTGAAAYGLALRRRARPAYVPYRGA
jgi:hypothetical protein